MEERPPERYSRMVQVGDVLYTAKRKNRVVFESPLESNTTITPTLGTVLEFESEVIAGGVRRCVFRLVWISSVTGEKKGALEFGDRLLYLDLLAPGQKVTVIEIC